MSYTIIVLASCPWGPATDHRVGLLTEMYVIYMEPYTWHRAIAQHCQPANSVRASYRTSPALLQHLASCQKQLARCQ